jgi:hypothetical protein
LLTPRRAAIIGLLEIHCGLRLEERKSTKKLERTTMAGMLRRALVDRDIARWIPWVATAAVFLFLMGYVDGTVYGSALGDSAGKLNYVHEFFHHARHVAFMCH